LSIANTHFRRQVRIGRYVADFASHSAKLIIEVDGGQHAGTMEADAARTKVLEAHGYRVLRFWNNDVLMNVDGVLEEIQRAVTTTPTPIPSPPEVGLARLRQETWPKSDKSDFGWGGEEQDRTASARGEDV
jgi:hypothetical protein